MKQIYSPTNGVFKLMFKQKKRFEHIILKASFLTILVLMGSLLSAQNYCYFESSKNTANTITPEAAIIEPLPDILQINDRIVEIIDNSDNLYLAIPQYNATTTAFEMLVRRVNASGTQLWSNVYNIPTANGNVIPAAIHLSPDGNLLVAGTYRVGGQVDYDAFLMKITPQGNLLWQETYSGNVNGFDGWFAVTTSDVGNIYVSGATTNQGITPDFAVMGLTPNGQQMWLKEKDQFGQIDLAAQIEYLNGAVFSSGVTQQNETTWGLLNASYDAIDGTVQFETPVTASNNELYQIERLIPDIENDLIYIVATHIRPTKAEFYLAKINTLTGQIIWESSEDLTAESDARARSAAIDENDNIYMVGYQKKQDTGRDITVEKYNATGQKIWTEYYDSSSKDDEAYDIVADNLGSLYLTGYGVEGTSDNKSYLTLKVNTDGDETWRKYYNGVYNDDDVAKRIELDNSNNILVSGTTKEGDDLRHTTVKYANDCTVELPQTESFSSSIAFIENRGQLLNTDGEAVKEIKYKSDKVSPTHYFFDDKVSMVFTEMNEEENNIESLHRVDINFVTNNDRGHGAYGLEKKSYHYNYYIGSGERHRERVGLYKNMVQTEVFPNIDIQYGSNSAGMLYSYIVKPGGNPSQILMNFTGQDNLSVLANGDLQIGTGIGNTKMPKPKAYQLENDGTTSAVNWQPSYSQNGDVIGFVTGTYDNTKVLVIECGKTPTTTNNSNVAIGNLSYSTHFGNAGFDETQDIKTNGTGIVDIALTGTTFSDMFPVIVGPFSDMTFAGSTDAFTTKMNELGQIKWSTFVGGMTSAYQTEVPGSDAGTAIAFDLNNNLYMAGTTNSNDIVPIASNGQYGDMTPIDSETFFSDSYLVGNAFIVQFDGNSGEVLWRTYYGGNNFVNPQGAEVNSDNHLVLICEFDDQSANLPPVVNNGNNFYIKNEGLINIIEFDESQAIHWNTRYGPNTSDEIGNFNFAIRDVDMDNEDNLLIVGKWSNLYGDDAIVIEQFANIGQGNYYEKEYLGDSWEDAYILKIKDRQPYYGTFFGGELYDEAFGVGYDVNNNIYISGFTDNGAIPGTTIPLQVPPIPGGYYNDEFGGGYLAKFTTNGDKLWTTYVGFGGDFVLFDMEVSKKGLVIITGTGTNINQEFLVDSPDAYNQSVANDPSNTSSPSNAVDVVIATFNPNYSQNWGTLVGGIGGEEGRKMSVSEDNKLCITGFVNNFDPDNQEPHYPTEDPLPNDDTNYFEPASFTNGKDAFISVFALDGVDLPTSTDNIDLLNNNITIFPNPTTSEIYYNIEEIPLGTSSIITIVDAFGKIVFELQTKQSENQKINVKNLSTGIYFLKIEADNQIFTQKFIKI